MLRGSVAGPGVASSLCEWCSVTATAERRGTPAGWARIDSRYSREQSAEVARPALIEYRNPEWGRLTRATT